MIDQQVVEGLDLLPEDVRPTWDVPDYLTHWAIDPDGTAMYFAGEPHVVDDLATWCQPDGVYAEFDRRVTLPLGVDWRLTLRRRPG